MTDQPEQPTYEPEYRRGKGAPALKEPDPRYSIVAQRRYLNAQNGGDGLELGVVKQEWKLREKEWEDSKSKLDFPRWYVDKYGLKEFLYACVVGMKSKQHVRERMHCMRLFAEAFIQKPKSAVEISTPQNQQIEISAEELLAIGLQANGINPDRAKELIKHSTN